MTANVSDWVGELTTTVGSGDISLGGQLDGYAPFDTIPDGQVWYSIKDGINRESGQGTLKENGTILERTIVSATLTSNQYAENPATALPLSGLANVYCTFNKAAFDQFNAAITLVNIGGYTEIVVNANLINASKFNVASVSDGAAPIVVSNVPDGSYTLTIQLTDAVIDLSNLSIKWAGAEVPEFTADTDLIFLTTIDNGATWLGSASLGYS